MFFQLWTQKCQWLIVLVVYALAFPCSAELFSNSYISFELPPNWKCTSDGTEQTCVSKFQNQSKEAIIVFTAKDAGPTDNVALYKSHLSTPKSITDNKGVLVPSKVLHVNERTISNHLWVDSLHLGSEIPSFYTRYLATVKDRLAIVITFSAHKDHYTKYSQNFLKTIESLRAVVNKDTLNTKPMATVTNRGGGSEIIGTPIAQYVEEPISPGATGNGKNSLATNIIALALLIGAVGFYLWRKRNR